MNKRPQYSKAFKALGVETPVLKALQAMEYETPSPIQAELIPHVLSGRDVLGQARTGTGKTASFGIPIVQQVDPQGRMQALILTPTRELAAQVLGEIRRLAKFTELHAVPVYGGTKIAAQIRDLGRKPHIAVGTPGRVMDMMQRNVLNLDDVRFIVLDEVDRMLDIGFREDIRRILGDIKHEHQTVFVSATLEGEVSRLAKRFMKDPVELNVSKDEITVTDIAQSYLVVEPQKKISTITKILKNEGPKLAIVFTRTKHGARKLAKQLHANGFTAKEIHGDLVQQKRERVMERFRKHHIPLLVATDLAARGIDVQGITHIINFDIPEDPEVYVHRIGRTARMGAKGIAISLVTPEQGPILTKIEMLINKEIQRYDLDGAADAEVDRSAPRKKKKKKTATPRRQDASPSGNASRAAQKKQGKVEDKRANAEEAPAAGDQSPQRPKRRPLFVKLPPRRPR